MKKAALTLIFCAFQLHIFAQSVDNIQLNFRGDSLYIQYDLVDSLNDSYSFQVFASHDNFSKPVKLLKGDIEEVSPGKNKLIKWDLSTELKEFNGSLAIELRGFLDSKPLKFIDPVGKVKKGKSITIKWEGGKPLNGYTLAWKSNGVVMNEQEIQQSRSILFTVPKSFSPGKYELLLSTADGNQPAITHPIMVKRKVPLGLTFSPVGAALIGGLIIALQPEPLPPLPTPPGPDEINN